MARRSRSTEGLSLAAVAELVGGELEGDPERIVDGVAEIELASAGDIAFLADRKRLRALSTTNAAAVLLSPELHFGQAPPSENVGLIRVGDPYCAVALVLDALYPLQPAINSIHGSAAIDPGAHLAKDVAVGAHVEIGIDAVIGARSEIGHGCTIGRAVQLGEDCVVYPNVTVYEGTRIGDRVVLHAGVVIGADGFGFARDGSDQLKIPQIGGVVIEDDVDIGANSCVDRGTLRDTRVGAGTKIDNLVQIGHNCDIGRQCAISAQTGLSGSTVLEDGVIVGGNVGTAGHQVIGAGSMLAARSGVHGDLPAGSVVGGSPHMEIGLWRRVIASLAKLPEFRRRVRRLEKALENRCEE